MAPTTICVVGGAGLIGLRHVQHCLDEPAVKLTCVVDPTPAGAELARKISRPLYASVDEMLAARSVGDVQVVGAILATPNATHVPLGVQLVTAGVHTLVEKPLATSSTSGRELVDAGARSGAKILTGHHRRFNPYMVNLKCIVDSGALGKILAVQGLWAAKKPSSYFESPTEWRKVPGTGGPVLINLVHDIDLLQYLFGAINRVYCELGTSTRGFEVEETGACTLRFASGAIGTFIFSDAAASPHHFESATGENPLMPQTGQTVYTVLGTGGTVSLPEAKLWHYADSTESWSDILQQDDAAPLDPTPPFTLQLRHFAEVCEGTAEPNCSGAEALKTIVVLEAIRKSMEIKSPVDVDHVRYCRNSST